MNHLTSTLLSPQELKDKYPLTRDERAFIDSSRETCRAIVDGRDPRLAVICGPCSIHNIESALKYACLLKNLSQKVDRKFFLIMRTYIEKPRTTIGWKGFLYRPDPTQDCDLLKGLELSRFLLREIVRLGLPIAIEILDPHIFPYFNDLISWGFIGSRTSASQIHRQIASLCNFPVGIKNTTNGSLEPAIYGILVAQEPQSFFGVGQDGRVSVIDSPGNPYAHLVLRGSDISPNCDKNSITLAKELLIQSHLRPSIIVDCSHGNSGKDFRKQPLNFHYLLQLAENDPESLSGMMLESHLKGSSQTHGEWPLDPEQSITDSCIDWESTEKLLTRPFQLDRTKVFVSTI